MDTIKSRCQRFDFKRITTDDIVKHLRYISDNEKINITDDALFTIAKNSAGGMRDSIALLDQLSVLDGDEAISTDDINNLLGRLSFDTLNSLADKIVNSKPQEAIEDLEKIYNSGNEPVQILTNLMDYLKNLLIVKNCRKEIAFELTQANDAQISALHKQTDILETHQIVFLIEKCSEYIKELKLTNNPRLWLEVAIIDLANLTENTSLVELQNRIARLEGGAATLNNNVKPSSYKTSPAPVLKSEIKQAPKNEPVQELPKTEVEVKNEPIKASEPAAVKDDFAPMPKAKSSNGEDISSLWSKLLENLSSAPTRALLKQWANPVKISPEETIVTMKNEIFLNQVQSGSKKQAVIDAVNTLFGQSDSNVIIRLPQAGDENVRQSSVVTKPSAPVKPAKPVEVKKEEVPEPEEIEEIKEEAAKTENTSSVDKVLSSMHSDNVNMVMDLFDGKVIE